MTLSLILQVELLCCFYKLGILNTFSYVLQIKTVLDVAEKVKHIVLLSGTPSLSRLWKSKLSVISIFCLLRILIIPKFVSLVTIGPLTFSIR